MLSPGSRASWQRGVLGLHQTGWPNPLRALIRSWSCWLPNENQKSFQKSLVYGSSNQAGIKHQKAVSLLAFFKPGFSQHFVKKVLLLDFLPKAHFTSLVASLCLFMSSSAGSMPVTPTSTQPSFHLRGWLQTISPTVKFWAIELFQLCHSKKGP